MLKSSIFLSYRREWLFESDYSPTVSAALQKAYGLIAHSSSQAAPWPDVYRILQPMVTQRMARPQFRNLCFLMGMAQASLERYDEALERLETAGDLSVELEDPVAIVEIAFLCGCLTRNQLHLSTASSYFEVALIAFQQLPDVEQLAHADTAFTVLVQLAFVTFYQAHFDESVTHLEQARQLVPRTSSPAQSRADIEWVEALLSRWGGHSENGLHQALALVDVIALEASTPSAVRAKLLVADLALDCAGYFPPGTSLASGPFLALARPYIQDAITLARSARDSSGLGLALLADVRLSRLEGRDAPRVATIEHVFDVAKQLGDIALLTQAHTALGDEFSFVGEKEAALACYRESLNALEPSDIAALGVWPRRSIGFIAEATVK